MKGIMVTLGIDDPGEAERIFDTLSEKGTMPSVTMMPFIGS